MRSVLLDVNVLVASFRQDHPSHDLARPWFDSVVASPQGFAVPATVWASFLRIVTHPRVFDPPSSVPEAFEFIDATRGQPGHLRAEPGPRHHLLLRRLCDEADARGDLVPDAVIGALAVEHGHAVASFDRDFARFDSVVSVRPGSS
ncbi:MAG: type II toxin-antitoxin system VapC family toxin [Phycicoccus sp.]